MIGISGYLKECSFFKRSRYESLFSDFAKLEKLNPEGYQANVQAWKMVCGVLFDKSDRLMWPYDDLVKALSLTDSGRKWQPMGLYIVLNELVNEDHSLIPIDAFKRLPIATEHTTNDTLFGSIRGLFWSRKFSNQLTAFNTKNSKAAYFDMDKLRQYSDIVRSKLHKENKQLEHIRRDHLFELVKEGIPKISKEEFELCILFLERDLGEIINNEGILTLLPKNVQETENIHSSTANINLADSKHIAQLNYTIYKIEQYIDEKHQEIELIDTEIKELVKKSSPASVAIAKSKLKFKKLTQAQLERSVNNVEQLQLVKLKLEETENNAKIVSVFNENTKILKSINDKIDVNDVDNVLEQLRNEIGKTNVISNTLSQNVGEQVDDDEINAELAKLEAEFGEQSNSNKDSLEQLEEKLSELKLPGDSPHAKEPHQPQPELANEAAITRVALPN
ncbi:Chm7 protein [Martiniozyma asiatica (nom. inval.)]|nr:Chm7 protein [Martiniozyma asiatica]